MKIDSYTLLVPLCGNNGLIGERAQVAGSKKLFQPRVAIAALLRRHTQTEASFILLRRIPRSLLQG